MRHTYTPEQRRMIEEWNRRLATEGLPDEPTQEEAVAWADPIDAQIAEELEQQGKETKFQQFAGSPESTRALIAQLKDIMADHPHAEKMIAKHESCVTNCPCVYLRVVDNGKVTNYHFNMRKIDTFRPETLEKIARSIGVSTE